MVTNDTFSNLILTSCNVCIFFKKEGSILCTNARTHTHTHTHAKAKLYESLCPLEEHSLYQTNIFDRNQDINQFNVSQTMNTVSTGKTD